MGVIGAAAAVVTSLALLAVPARAEPPPPLTDRFCLQPTETGPEIYGPTDVNAVTGNRRLTAALNAEGTLTVLKWPSPSYADQLRYRTISRDLPDLGVAPNEGSFLGVVVAGRTVWLRELPTTQHHPDDASDLVVTVHDGGTFTVTVSDVVASGIDVLARQVEVDPPTAVDAVIAFAHFAPTTIHFPGFPTYDWCQDDLIAAAAAYDAALDAVTTSGPGVGLASGFGGSSGGHQVGDDAYWLGPLAGLPLGLGPTDAYDDAADGRLSGSDRAPGPQVDLALSTAPDVDGRATFLLAAGRDVAAAAAALTSARATPFEDLAAAKKATLADWLSSAPMPAGGGAAVAALARRTYITIWQATDERGAIVASITTQSPYGEDWPRDSAFINHLVDRAGHPEEVARHNRFLADVQVRAGRPPPVGALAVPPGNWAMNYYADGTVGGPIPWEIDETGFGAWTLWDHYTFTGDLAYLVDVYPAIAAAADFLTGLGRDPLTGLTIPASEDDHPELTYPATMHASGPTLLALRSAVQAAAVLGRHADADRWRARAVEVAAAIDRRYHASADPLAWTDDFGVGGWALWPVEVEPQATPRMRAQAALALDGVVGSFDAPASGPTRSAYEAKALLGVAVHANATGDAAALEVVRRGLLWIAEVQATAGTHLLGEVWVVRDGRVTAVVAQPHVWEMTLFTLAALEAWGATSDALLPAPVTPAESAEPPLPATGDTPDPGGALLAFAAGLLLSQVARSARGRLT